MYQMLKDKTNILKDYSSIGEKCYVCNGESHLFRNCPETHLVIDKRSIIREHLKTTKSFEQKYKRKSRKRFHVLVKQRSVKTAILKIKTEDFMKNQVTTSMTDMDANSSEQNNRTRKDTIFAEEIEEELDHIELRKGQFYTLKRIKDFDTGVMRLVKERDIIKKSEMKRAVTMKQNGENAYASIHIQTVQDIRQSNDEVIVDQVRNYEIYFPHNNITKIIQNLESKNHQNKNSRINQSSEQDFTFLKLKLGRIFERSRKKTSSDVSSREGSPSVSRRKSLFHKSPRPILMRQRSKSVPKTDPDAIQRSFVKALRRKRSSMD